MRTGGYRPGAGRPRKSRGEFPVPTDVALDAKAAKMQPLEYMLMVMNDATADPTRRDRMAIAAAPFCHPRISDTRVGKKETRAKEAKIAGMGTPWAGDLEYEIRAS
jgi:hypothetical protein